MIGLEPDLQLPVGDAVLLLQGVLRLDESCWISSDRRRSWYLKGGPATSDSSRSRNPSPRVFRGKCLRTGTAPPSPYNPSSGTSARLPDLLVLHRCCRHVSLLPASGARLRDPCNLGLIFVALASWSYARPEVILQPSGMYLRPPRELDTRYIRRWCTGRWTKCLQKLARPFPCWVTKGHF